MVVLGPVERELYARLADDPFQGGTRRAEELTWRIAGCGAEVSTRLAKLGISTAIVTGAALNEEDKEVLSTLRKRGVHTRGARSKPRKLPVTIRIRAPGRELRVVSPQSDELLPRHLVLRSILASRHFHVCGSLLNDHQSVDTVRNGLLRASDHGVSASLDLWCISPDRATTVPPELLEHVEVVFASSKSLRLLTDRGRIGDAATATLKMGVRAVAIRLGAGGFRIYFRDETLRVPRFSRPVEAENDAFASGFLLGWLLGSSPSVCGVIGGAAAAATRAGRLSDRRALVSRLAEVRTLPAFRRLVPVLSEAQRLLERARRLPRRNRTAAKTP